MDGEARDLVLEVDGLELAVLHVGIYDEIHRLTVSYENEEIRITMTFGLEEYDKNDGMEMAIRRADEKLYQGKETGRDKIVY